MPAIMPRSFTALAASRAATRRWGGSPRPMSSTISPSLELAGSIAALQPRAGLEDQPPLGEQAARPRDRQRLAVQPALRLGAADRTQPLLDRGVFHPLGRNRQVQALAQPEDR